MPLAPDSPEFTRLATRWLDGVCTDAEAEQFWKAIGESRACARAFADMARFELLLETTYSEVAREAIVTAAAEVKGASHRRRTLVRQSLKIAAVITVMSTIMWLVWPSPEAQMQTEVAQAKPPAPMLVKRPGQPDRLLIAPPATGLTSAKKATKARPLPQHLDEFFLTSLAFDKTKLRDAIRQMEAQLRELNFARATDLDRLHIALPASALGREVTFKSGPISFLKALRAIAALADCDVDVTDTGVALSTRRLPPNAPMENRAVASLLAADGIGRHSSLSDLLEDARALGMAGITNDTISGTAAQFEALAQLAESRRQVRQLPDLSFLAYVLPAGPRDQSHVLTAAEQKALAGKVTDGQTIIIDPGASSQTPASLRLTAVPAGDGHQITVSPPTLTPTEALTSPGDPNTPTPLPRTPDLPSSPGAPAIPALPLAFNEQLPMDVLLADKQGFTLVIPPSLVPITTGTVPQSAGSTDTSTSVLTGGNVASGLTIAGTTGQTATLAFNNQTASSTPIVNQGSGAQVLGGTASFNGAINSGTMLDTGTYTISSGTLTFDTAAMALRNLTVSANANGTYTVRNTATGVTQTFAVSNGAQVIITPAPTPEQP